MLATNTAGEERKGRKGRILQKLNYVGVVDGDELERTWGKGSNGRELWYERSIPYIDEASA